MSGPSADAGDVAALYRRYERPLRCWLRRRLTAPDALVEDACADAWVILLAKRPVCGERIFGWLTTTALHEAYRLLRVQRREQPSDAPGEWPALVPRSRDDPETVLEAKRALGALASLRERERIYFGWQIGGYRYREMQALAGDASYTNVNKYLVRAHARLREFTDQDNKLEGGAKMTTAMCRRCGRRPRRLRHGAVEPLCEECHAEAMAKVAREFAGESAADGRERYRKLKLMRGGGQPGEPPKRAASLAPAGNRALVGSLERPSRARIAEASPGGRTRCIRESQLQEARRLYGLGLSMRAVAETLLRETMYANAHSAEVALRYHFKRRGWPLRNRPTAHRACHAQRQGNGLARAA